MRHTSRLLEIGTQQHLPFWAERGWDRRNGGFHEALDMSGEALAGISRRVRTQARQSYVLARCTEAGWLDEADRAVEGLAFLKSKAWQAGGQPGWAHRLDDQGDVTDSRRDLYDHAFVILACAWVFKVSGDSQFRDLAYATLDFVETDLASARRGFIEAIGAPTLPRRQNPHMHLFEALMALYEVTEDRGLLPRIFELKDLFDNAFFQSGPGHLLEFFTEDWQPHPDRGHILEPGHFCEWVWLLAECERLTGVNPGQAGQALFASATASGINARTGLLFAAVSPQGDPIDAGSRTWMQTEWVRAASIELKRGNAIAAEVLEQASSALLERHLEAGISGGWNDSISADGSIRSTNMPASTLYHLVGSLLEIAELQASGRLSRNPSLLV